MRGFRVRVTDDVDCVRSTSEALGPGVAGSCDNDIAGGGTLSFSGEEVIFFVEFHA